MPHVQNFADQLKQQGVNVLVITLPEEVKLSQACMAAHHVTLPLLISDDAALNRFQVASSPAAYLLDAQGKVVWTDLNRTNTLSAALSRLGVACAPHVSK